MDTITRILIATQHAHDFITGHGLPCYRLDVQAGSDSSKVYNPATKDWDLPSLPTLTVALHEGEEFVRWFDLTGVDRVKVKRRELDTTVNAHARLNGFTWSFWGSLPRPDSGPHLPGVKAGWGKDGYGRNEAIVTPAEFAVAAEALAGIREARRAAVQQQGAKA